MPTLHYSDKLKSYFNFEKIEPFSLLEKTEEEVQNVELSDYLTKSSMAISNKLSEELLKSEEIENSKKIKTILHEVLIS